MAGLQFGRIPGINLPIYLPLAFGAVVASFLHPRLARSMHPLEFAWIALIITRAVTMALNAKGFIDYSLVHPVVDPIVVVARPGSAATGDISQRFGQIFAVVAALNGVFGMYWWRSIPEPDRAAIF